MLTIHSGLVKFYITYLILLPDFLVPSLTPILSGGSMCLEEGMESKPVALITGASKGIGRAVAVALSEAGFRLALAARSEAGLRETARICRISDALFFPADLADEGAPEALAERAINAAGRLDLLVNNAGGVLSRSFEETTAADWDRLMALNARAPFLLTRAVLPVLRRSPRAAVVNIGSVVSFKGYELQAAYTASKHALAGWTKVLAREVSEEGIRVHLIAPGGVATDMARDVRPDIDETGLIAPGEIARALVFLIQNRGNAVIDVMNIHRAGKLPFA
jgi:NAD(P)-dependent dehydrogenase (short-subunit alcohol dehydrogenase family)